jgi:hypothetical protein
MKKIIKIFGLCLSFSLLINAHESFVTALQGKSLPNRGEHTDLAGLPGLEKIWICTDTKKCNYRHACPEFSEGHLFDSINYIFLELPVYDTTLKTVLAQLAQYADSSRDISVKLWPYRRIKKFSDKYKEYEISFFFLQSILNRNDSNAHYIKRYLETNDIIDSDRFDVILQSESNQFMQNTLNRDNVVFSLLKQIYHAVTSAYIIASNSSFSGGCAWASAFQMYAIVLTGFFLVLNQASWISKFSLVALVAATVVAVGHIGGVSPPHWYQFDILNMLSKGFTTIKYGMGTTAMAFLTWVFYGAINQYRLDVARNLLRERTFSSEITNIPQLGDLVMDYVGGDLT